MGNEPGQGMDATNTELKETARVLVVEDEADVESLLRQAFRRKIRAKELEFEFAQNGQIALDKLKDGYDPHLILTDINMPEMDGLTLLGKLQDSAPHTPAVIVSAYSDTANIRVAMNRGAFDFQTKPIDLDDLGKTIAKTLNYAHHLRRSNEAEKYKREKELAEASSRFKSQFLSSTSHELRTPLNAIMGFTELLMDEAEDEGREVPMELGRIKGAADHLLALINDLLDLSKIEAGRLELALSSFDVAELVQEVSGTIQPLLAKNNNSLEIDVSDRAGSMVADAGRVRQCLLNLLSNALKFTESGTVSIKVTREVIDDVESLVFAVADTGIGMTAEQVGRLFQEFTQATAETSQKYGGTGLGLSITKRLSQLMGGDVGVTSQYEVGSTFTIRLPATVVLPGSHPESDE